MEKTIRTALAILLCCALLPAPAAYASTEQQPAASEGTGLEESASGKHDPQPTAPGGDEQEEESVGEPGHEEPVSVESGAVTAPESQISTPEELAALAAYIRSGGDSSGKAWTLTEDIDLTGTSWFGIGTKNIPFRGSFDGAGYTVTLPEESSCGLFVHAQSAQIQNVVVAGSLFSETYMVGGVVGYAEASTIENCVNQADIVHVTSADSGCTGGVAGWTAMGVTILNCRNEGAISGTCRQSGGIVGHASDGRIVECQNTGDISGRSVYMGGIAGRVERATVSSSWNTGSVISKSAVSGSKYGYVGGLIGFGTSLLVNTSWNAGNIHDSSGIAIGYCGGMAGAIYYGRMENCYNMGSAISDSDRVSVGGMLGALSNGIVLNAYDAGDSAEFLGRSDEMDYTLENCTKQTQSDGSESVVCMTAAELTSGTLPIQDWDETIWVCVPGMYPRLAVSAADNESIVWTAGAVADGMTLNLSAFEGGQWMWGETELNEGMQFTLTESPEVIFTRGGISRTVPVEEGTYTVHLVSVADEASLDVSIGTMIESQWVPVSTWKEGAHVNAEIRVENGSGNYTYQTLTWTDGLVLESDQISGTITGFPGSTVQVRVHDTDTGAYGISNVVMVDYSGGVQWNEPGTDRVYNGMSPTAGWYLEDGREAEWSASYVYWRKMDAGYEKTTPANSGSETVGGAPVWTGTYRAVCWRGGKQIGETADDFTILPRPLTAQDLDMDALASAEEYNGGPVTKDTAGLIRSQLLQVEDLDVAYTGNTAPGVAAVTVTGKRNFSGSVEGAFEIRLGTEAAQGDGGLSLTLAADTAYTFGGNKTTQWYLADQPEILYFGGTEFYVPESGSYQFYIREENAA